MRVIEGQETKLARPMHHIALDTIHDEIVVTNSHAHAILFFKGGVGGEQAPLRIIQGPKTMLADNTDNVDVDPVHDEVFTAQAQTHSILVFDRNANGDVAPTRIIHGAKTQLRSPAKVVVDYIHDLLIVTNRGVRGRPGGVLIFNRTDNGDVAPQAEITVEGMGRLVGGPAKIAVDRENRNIFLALTEENRRTRDHPVRRNSIGIWKYTIGETVTVSQWAILTDVSDPDLALEGIGLNPDDKEILVLNKQRPPSVRIYRVPEAFE